MRNSISMSIDRCKSTYLHGHFLDSRVDVEDAGVASGDDRLRLEHDHLGVEDAAGLAGRLGRAEHEAGENVRLLNALELQLDIVAGVHLIGLGVVGPALEDLHTRLKGEI